MIFVKNTEFVKKIEVTTWIKKYNNHEELKSYTKSETHIYDKRKKTAFGGCTEKALETNKKTDGLF